MGTPVFESLIAHHCRKNIITIVIPQNKILGIAF